MICEMSPGRMAGRCDCSLPLVYLCGCSHAPWLAALPFKMDGLESIDLTEHWGKQSPLSHSRSLPLSAGFFLHCSVSSLRVHLSLSFIFCLVIFFNTICDIYKIGQLQNLELQGIFFSQFFFLAVSFSLPCTTLFLHISAELLSIFCPIGL